MQGKKGVAAGVPGADLKVILIISHVSPPSSTPQLYSGQRGAGGEAHRSRGRGVRSFAAVSKKQGGKRKVRVDSLRCEDGQNVFLTH